MSPTSSPPAVFRTAASSIPQPPVPRSRIIAVAGETTDTRSGRWPWSSCGTGRSSTTSRNRRSRSGTSAPSIQRPLGKARDRHKSPCPYRDDIFSELQRRLDTRIFLLADDEPGRGWSGARFRIDTPGCPRLAIRGERPRYLPLPTWLFRQGFILVGGFGAPALLTALIRPKSTLIWSEATHITEAGRGRRRIRLRRWLVSRSRGVVAVGEASARYLSSRSRESSYACQTS